MYVIIVIIVIFGCIIVMQEFSLSHSPIPKYILLAQQHLLSLLQAFKLFLHH